MTRRVVVAGMYRSASTLLYNIVRLGYERQHGIRNVWSGYVDWYQPPVRAEYHVIKTAQLEPALFKDSTILLSWRELADVEASMKRFAEFHPEPRRDTSWWRIPEYTRWCLEWATHAKRIVYYDVLTDTYLGILETEKIFQLIGCDQPPELIYRAACDLPIPTEGKTSSVTLLHAHHRTLTDWRTTAQSGCPLCGSRRKGRAAKAGVTYLCGTRTMIDKTEGIKLVQSDNCKSNAANQSGRDHGQGMGT